MGKKPPKRLGSENLARKITTTTQKEIITIMKV